MKKKIIFSFLMIFYSTQLFAYRHLGSNFCAVNNNSGRYFFSWQNRIDYLKPNISFRFNSVPISNLKTPFFSYGKIQKTSLFSLIENGGISEPSETVFTDGFYLQSVKDKGDSLLFYFSSKMIPALIADKVNWNGQFLLNQKNEFYQTGMGFNFFSPIFFHRRKPTNRKCFNSGEDLDLKFSFYSFKDQFRFDSNLKSFYDTDNSWWFSEKKCSVTDSLFRFYSSISLMWPRGKVVGASSISIDQIKRSGAIFALLYQQKIKKLKFSGGFRSAFGSYQKEIGRLSSRHISTFFKWDIDAGRGVRLDGVWCRSIDIPLLVRDLYFPLKERIWVRLFYQSADFNFYFRFKGSGKVEGNGERRIFYQIDNSFSSDLVNKNKICLVGKSYFLFLFYNKTNINSQVNFELNLVVDRVQLKGRSGFFINVSDIFFQKKIKKIQPNFSLCLEFPISIGKISFAFCLNNEIYKFNGDNEFLKFTQIS